MLFVQGDICPQHSRCILIVTPAVYWSIAMIKENNDYCKGTKIVSIIVWDISLSLISLLWWRERSVDSRPQLGDINETDCSGEKQSRSARMTVLCGDFRWWSWSWMIEDSITPVRILNKLILSPNKRGSSVAGVSNVFQSLVCLLLAAAILLGQISCPFNRLAQEEKESLAHHRRLI